jgi:hypothetical protein
MFVSRIMQKSVQISASVTLNSDQIIPTRLIQGTIRMGNKDTATGGLRLNEFATIGSCRSTGRDQHEYLASDRNADTTFDLTVFELVTEYDANFILLRLSPN